MHERELSREIARWRWFPLGIVGALVLVAIVNSGMVYAALHTNPGAAGVDGFDLSNRYDTVIARSEVQSRLGWHVEASAGSDRHPFLRLTGAGGKPLEHVQVSAQAERPVGPPRTTALTLEAAPDGRLVAREALFSGQWVVGITVSRDGQVLTATERLVVR